MGKKLKSPMDFLIDSNTVPVGSYNQRQAKQYVNRLMSTLRDTSESTRQNLDRSRKNQKSTFDKKVKGNVSNLNDSVML